MGSRSVSASAPLLPFIGLRLECAELSRPCCPVRDADISAVFRFLRPNDMPQLLANDASVLAAVDGFCGLEPDPASGDVARGTW